MAATDTTTSSQIKNLNTQQILDRVISTYTTTHIMKLMNSKHEMSVKNIGYMLFVFSIAEIKDFIKTMYGKIKTNISSTKDPIIKVIYTSFNSVWNKITWIFYRRVKNEPEIIIERPVSLESTLKDDNIIINIQLPVNILDMIVKYQENTSSSG